MSEHVTFVNDDIDVGAYTGGGLVNLHTADYWTFRDDTFGPSCCGLHGSTGTSPVAINVGKPNSNPAACGSTEACHLVIDHDLFQYTSRNAELLAVHLAEAARTRQLLELGGLPHGHDPHLGRRGRPDHRQPDVRPRLQRDPPRE